MQTHYKIGDLIELNTDELQGIGVIVNVVDDHSRVQIYWLKTPMDTYPSFRIMWLSPSSIQRVQ
jgi:hypothetical protein